MTQSPSLARVRRYALLALAALALASPYAAHAATVTISPPPVGGRVTSDIGGIDCPGTCTSADLGSFASVTLTATADPGYFFLNWDDTVFGQDPSNPLFIFLSASRTLAVAFGGAPTLPGPNAGALTVLTAGSVTIPTTGSPAPTVSKVSGSLPTGVTLAADGALSGTPVSGSVGSYPITVSASNLYGSANTVYTLSIEKKNQAIGFAVAPPSTVLLSSGSINLQGQATSGLFQTYTTTTPSVCTPWFYGVTFVATGTCEVQADQAGDGDWNAAPPVTLPIIVQAAPTISSSNIATFPVGQAMQFQLAATGFPAPTIGLTGTLPPGLAFNPATNQIAGSALAGTVGTYPVQVTASNGIGTVATQNLELNVAKGTQAISPTPSPRRGRLVGDPPFDIEASSSSLLPLSFTASTPAVCSVSGARVTLTGARGACTLTATQAGDANFLAATPETWSIDVDSARIDTVAGGGVLDGGAAIDALLNRPAAAVLLSDGSLLVADQDNHRVRKVTGGTITTFAGTGIRGFTGDGGPANAARLDTPAGLAVDGAGNVYIADAGNHRIRKVAPSGTITTFAGSGARGFSGDGGAATSAALFSPRGLAVSPAGDVHFVDGGRFIRKVTPAGAISTVAGNRVAGYHGDGGPALNAALNDAWSLAFDAAGHLYVSDSFNFRVRRISATTGTITTFAGTGVNNFASDGGAATATAISRPRGIAVDSAGHLLIAEPLNFRVRKVDGSGLVSTVAGGGAFPGVDDGGAATDAVVRPEALAAGPGGTFHVVDQVTSQVRHVTGAGTIFTVVNKARATFGGDGGQGTNALLSYPAGIARDGAGNLFIADRENQRVRKLTPAGVITTVAGSGTGGFSGDGGPATSAQLLGPQAVAVDAAGNLYISDTQNMRVRKVTPQGTISTFAGSGGFDFAGDGGPATAASLGPTSGLAVAPDGALHIATSHNRVRRVSPAGIITTVAGNGNFGIGGDGGPATSASVSAMGISFDAAGNLLIADYGNSIVRKVDTAGTITTLAGTGLVGYEGDGGPATAAKLRTPTDVAADPFGNVYIADANNDVIRRVDGATGVITTLTNPSVIPRAGEAEPPSVATLNRPEAVVSDALGNLFISDSSDHRIRKVTFDSQPVAFAFPAQTGVATGSLRQSAAITPTGYDATAVVTVTGGEHSVGCTGTFTAARGAINPGQSVCVRHVASGTSGATVTTTLSIGGVQGSFSSTATAAVAQFALTVTKAGGGLGTVNSSLAGIDCGSSCSANYGADAIVTLTATPASGSVFSGWSGACTGTGLCQLTMSAARNVTATFSLAGTPGALSANPGSLDFGSQSMNTTSPALAVTLTNAGGSAVTVNSVSASTWFAVTHDCTTLAAGASCTASVAFTPAAQGSLNGTLTVASGAGNTTAPLAGTGERSLVTHYYRSILRRAPDAGGKGFWEAEAARVQALGLNVNEVWFAMAGSFFASAEYLALGRDDAGFVTDLYNTFFNRPPDGPGLAFWTGELAGGLPREVALVSFMFSTEFVNFTQAIFGTTAARAEIDAVTDFFRGLLGRLPDDGGFAFWVGQFRAAQCAGGAAVNTQVESISSLFALSAEYASRGRTNAQYAGDLYNAFLRRGGDRAGVLFWINEIASGARTRENVRQAFVASPEFQSRVAAIIAAGCVP